MKLSTHSNTATKEFCKAMFCLLVVLIFLCVLVCKKGFLCKSSKVCRGYQKVAHEKKNHKNAKQTCQMALFSSKTASLSLKPYTVFCFDLQSCVILRLYKLSCKWLTALLTFTGTRLKDPR